MLNGLTPTDQLTLLMFDKTQEKFRRVTVAVAQINRKHGRDTARFTVARTDGGLIGSGKAKPDSIRH